MTRMLTPLQTQTACVTACVTAGVTAPLNDKEGWRVISQKVTTGQLLEMKSDTGIWISIRDEMTGVTQMRDVCTAH